MVVAFRRDRKDTGDARCVLGMLKGGEAEQGMDRGKARVSGLDAVTAFCFEVVEESGDDGCVEVGQVEP